MAAVTGMAAIKVSAPVMAATEALVMAEAEVAVMQLSRRLTINSPSIRTKVAKATNSNNSVGGR